MGIKKQEFYEGAALHLLARGGGLSSICYRSPFFVLNGNVHVYLKHCTKNRSPWSFTFGAEEQVMLEKASPYFRIVIGLICGSDGVATVEYKAFRSIATIRGSSIHVACSRPHGKQYQVSGPDGILNGKVAPSDWLRILT